MFAEVASVQAVPVPVKSGSAVRVVEIKRAVCAFYDLEPEAMTCESRSLRVARPRQIAMYLCRKLTPRTLPEIGRLFGGRDHTTVLHATRLIEHLISRDADMAGDVADITAALGVQA